jgi:FAD/FMN-containing dehydrogenase
MSTTDALPDLRRSLVGAVIEPGDGEYDAARRPFNALIDRRPAVIARCVSAADVATALDFARSNGSEVAVRGGGHNPAGHCVVDDGIVIDLSQMRSVEVDTAAGIARAAGGATWLDFDTASQAFGLVTPGGVVGSTGVAGLTLGGGIGHLTPQYGLTCDNFVGAELVTPDGKVVQASTNENAELLWALRGGGGNFGVVTRLDFRLHELDSVVGGRLTFRGKSVRDTFRRFRDLAATSPDELALQAGLGVDESLAPTLGVFPCYTGSETDPRELQDFRSTSGLVDGGLRAHTFMDQQRIFDSPFGVSRHYWKGHFVRELPDELIDMLLDRIVALGRSPGGILIESLHGAPKALDGDDAVVGWRQAAFNVSAMAEWQDPALDDEHIAWARETADALEPWSFSGGGYVNYMQGDEPIERVRAAFGDGAFERLRALKRRYDPENVLHRNQNVPPA